MSRAHTTGRLMMGVAAIQLLLFVLGVRRRSYLALALPVGVAMLAQTALTFWLGWTMLTAEEEAEEPAPTG